VLDLRGKQCLEAEGDLPFPISAVDGPRRFKVLLEVEALGLGEEDAEAPNTCDPVEPKGARIVVDLAAARHVPGTIPPEDPVGSRQPRVPPDSDV
jgi:hypothetical protein